MCEDSGSCILNELQLWDLVEQQKKQKKLQQRSILEKNPRTLIYIWIL